MNDKLRFQFSKVAPTIGRPAVSSQSDVLLSVAITKAGRNKKMQLYALTFSLHARAVEQAGWTDGTRLDLIVDDEACVLFVSPDAEAICRVLRKVGKHSRRYQVSFTLPVAIDPWHRTVLRKPCSEVEIEGGRIAFKMPPKFGES